MINKIFKASLIFSNYLFHKNILLDECQVDDDCPFSKECKDNECKDPCLRISCGSRAECKAEAHKAVCYCPPGMQGNPFISCSEVGCTSNSDCSKLFDLPVTTLNSVKSEKYWGYQVNFCLHINAWDIFFEKCYIFLEAKKFQFPTL